MPTRAKKPCTYPGCGALVDGTRCEKHKHTESREHDKRRGSAANRGYTWQWHKARDVYLRQHPLCECAECEVAHRLLPSQAVDHIIPHKGDPVLMWDESNWRAMAKRCHDRKTAREDGGFGRVRTIA